MGLIEDDFHDKVTLKSAQSRISEFHVAEAVFRTLSGKRNVLYTFPAGEQMQQFVDSRVRQAILENESLAKFVTGSLNLKKIELNHNQIYFRGVQKRRQVISVDVSDWYGDEIDEYGDDSIVYTVTKRLGAAKNPRIRLFSTPTFDGTGISLRYFGSESQKDKGSDQRVWTIQCEICGHWNENLIWEENVVDLNDSKLSSIDYQPNVIIVCRRCRKQLNRLSNRAEWVPKFPSLSDFRHGYHISKLFAPGADLNRMMEDSRNPLKEQEFNNSDLGRPYQPKGSRLTEEALDVIRGNYQIHIRNTFRAYGGFDIGSKIHATVAIHDDANRLKVIRPVELDDWDDMQLFYNDMGIRSAVIDANPDKKEAIEFQRANDGVWVAYFSQALENTTELWKLNWDEGIINIHRTLAMAFASDLIFKREVTLPIDIRRVPNFYDQMRAPIKAQKQDVRGNWISFYPKTNEADHYYFSFVYLVTAASIRSQPAKLRHVNMIRR